MSLQSSRRYLLAAVLASLFSTIPASGAVIESFSAERFSTGPFIEVINSSFTPTTAKITNTTLTCMRSAGCDGLAIYYEMRGSGFTADTSIGITIDGSLTNPTAPSDEEGYGDVEGTVNVVVAFGGIPGALQRMFEFTVSPGSFDTTILQPLDIPAAGDGNFTVTGYIALAMLQGQVLSLPDSMTFTLGSGSVGNPPAVPEPATLGLLGSGLAGILLAAKRRKTV